jgi:hypothetical protein
MPDKLWEIFRHNRPLLGTLFNCATQQLIAWTKAKGLDIGLQEGEKGDGRITVREFYFGGLFRGILS